MKNILLALTFLFLGCSTMAPIQEGKIFVTKRYAGRVIKYDHVLIEQVFLNGLRTSKKCTIILTSREFIRVKGHIEIPDYAVCYIRIEPWYFTWTGSAEEYRIIR